MTDEELIARLRQEGYDHFGRTSADLAANRIEALIADLENAVDVLREILFTSNEDHTGNWLDALLRGQAFLIRFDNLPQDKKINERAKN